jgi:hypothetical protein
MQQHPATTLCNNTPHNDMLFHAYSTMCYSIKNTATAFGKRMIGEPQTMSGLPTILGKKPE